MALFCGLYLPLVGCGDSGRRVEATELCFIEIPPAEGEPPYNQRVALLP